MTTTIVVPFVPEDFEAVVRLQALLRWWRGAREATARRVEREQAQVAQRAAAHLQSVERGRIVRKGVSLSDRQHEQALCRAAARLQSVQRSRTLRAELAAEREPSPSLRTLVELVDDTRKGGLVDDTRGSEGAQGSATSQAQQVGPRRGRSMWGSHQDEGDQIAGPTKLISRLAQLQNATSGMCGPPSGCRVPIGSARARPLALRLLRAVLGMYVVMLCGGYLLFVTEAQHEINSACADRADENRRRESMRLLPLMDSVCASASHNMPS